MLSGDRLCNRPCEQMQILLFWSLMQLIFDVLSWDLVNDRAPTRYIREIERVTQVINN